MHLCLDLFFVHFGLNVGVDPAARGAGGPGSPGQPAAGQPAAGPGPGARRRAGGGSLIYDFVCIDIFLVYFGIFVGILWPGGRLGPQLCCCLDCWLGGRRARGGGLPALLLRR